MPLRDHFHAPLYPARHWESFHSLWAGEIVARLNARLLPPGYFAESQVHLGPWIEIDVATMSGPTPATPPTGNGAVATLPAPTWAPPEPSLMLPGVSTDEFEVRILDEASNLVAAVELVSPGNKDRPEHRLAFCHKCAAYLQRGIGLVVVDVVTNRRACLHDHLIDALALSEDLHFPGGPTPISAVSYRPEQTEAGAVVAVWAFRLALGQEMPTLPLALRSGPVLALDLEATYSEACVRSRF